MHRKSLRRASAIVPSAPYRKQIISNARNKPSLFSKIKTFFTQKDSARVSPRNNVANKQPRNESFNRRISSMPGGYFHSEISPDSTVNRSVVVSAVGEARNDIENKEEEYDETHETNISNAKLANFFSKKGNEPLSEIEIEGVMSLLQKSSKSMITSEREQKSAEGNNIDQSLILKESGSTPISISNAPTFNPKYDTSNASMNTTLGSIGSRKYSFNYSSLPSPYKATVYRYSAAKKIPDTYTANTSAQSIASAKSVRSGVSKSAPSKKISNTAAALVSLLDENDSKKNNAASELANPYSSYVSQIRKHKRVSPNAAPRQEISEEETTVKPLFQNVPEQGEEPMKQLKPPKFHHLRQAKILLLNTNLQGPHPYAQMSSNVEPTENAYKSENAPSASSKEFNFTNLQAKPLVGKPKTELTKGDSTPVQPDLSVTPQKSSSKGFVFNSVQKKSRSNLSQENDNEGKHISAPIDNDFSEEKAEEFDFNVPVVSKQLGNGLVDENKVEAFKSLYTF
ncbi:FG-nucleoporin component of central core of the nuclear pore complex [Saccharomyces cerevisiae]|nr:NUP60p FG-nucleoporin component of central core of the nuclear pore complex [Saccharomyces boulardii (nom. inval.)]KQC45758.1 FG-nucleoporin component of central core of the nuclear pore complex [Saccharomyces boulardii (nom. inval.)]